MNRIVWDRQDITAVWLPPIFIALIHIRPEPEGFPSAPISRIIRSLVSGPQA